MDMFDTQLEGLLREKSFGELTKSEKEHVLKFINEEEYTRCHLVLKATIKTYSITSIIQPESSIENNLKKAFKAKFKKPLFYLDTSQFNLPELNIKQMVLASLFLLFVAYFISGPSPSLQTPMQTKSLKKPIKGNEIQNTSAANIVENQPVIVPKRKIKENINFQQKSVDIKRENESMVSNHDTIQLCLTLDVEPIGLNINLEEYYKPGLTTNLTYQ